MSGDIVIVTRSLPLHRLGGMETVAWDLAREFVRQGSPVRVITTSLGDGADELNVDGVRIFGIREAPPARYSAAWWAGSRALFEAQCMESTRAVLSVSAAGFGLLPIRPHLGRVPFVMQAHGTSWAEVVSKWHSRNIPRMASSARNLIWLVRDLSAYRRFDAVVAVGERVYASLCSPPASWCIPPGGVHLINNGIDQRVFKPDRASRLEVRRALGIQGETPVVISANRLHAQKGMQRCLEALRRLADRVPDYRYVIVGDGPERRRLEDTAARLGMAGKVRFLGRTDREQLAWWLRGADALLFLTEHQEGLPLNVLEAIASGLPVIASDHLRLFASTAIRPVNPRAPELVCEALLEMLCGTRTPAKLPEEFNLEYSARRYLSLFDVCRN